MPHDLHELRLPPARPGERLDMLLTHAEATAARGALVFSPHPLLGGDLDNNVLRAVAHRLAASGRPALRFDYRGVGASEPVEPDVPRFEYWTRVEQADDHEAVLADAAEAWRRAEELFEPALLVGYSYGAFVAARHAQAAAPAAPLVLVSPPVRRLALDAVASHAGPVLAVLAEHDGFESAADPDELAARWPRAEVRVVAGADHFWLDREAELADLVLEFLEREAPCAAA